VKEHKQVVLALLAYRNNNLSVARMGKSQEIMSTFLSKVVHQTHWGKTDHVAQFTVFHRNFQTSKEMISAVCPITDNNFIKQLFE